MEHVLPEATYRQWVLTFPWEARLFIAIDRQLLSDLLREFLRTVFSWQRRMGRHTGLTDGHCGAVTFVQRFGGALNTNPHFHVPRNSAGRNGPGSAAPRPRPSVTEVSGRILHPIFSSLASRVPDRTGPFHLAHLSGKWTPSDPCHSLENPHFFAIPVP